MSHSLWAVGRNYRDHAKEMKAPLPAEPLVFLKSMACLSDSSQITIPDWTADLHYELEIAVRLGPQLQPTDVALALDLTARDHQQKAKTQGLPWSLAKSFTNSCPISPWVPYQGDAWFRDLTFKLHINGIEAQLGHTDSMIFKLDDILAHLKKHFPVQGNDIILTGTPSGVGPLKSGDLLIADLEELIHWELKVL